MRFLSALRFDILFQFRHGFYAVYLVVCGLYIGVLQILPEDIAASLLPVIIFTDPAMLGIIFIGAIVLLEKDERTIQSLFVTPLRLGEYFASRLVSLGFISLLTSLAIAFAQRGIGFYPHLLISGVLLTAGFFTLIGFAVAARVRSFNEFLMGTALLIVLASLPLLDHFSVFTSPLMYLLPSQASLVLIRGAFGGVPVAEQIYALVYLSLCCWGGWRLATRQFTSRVIGRIGDR